MRLDKVLWKIISVLSSLTSWRQVYLSVIDGKRRLDWIMNLISKSPWAVLRSTAFLVNKMAGLSRVSF